MIRKFKMPFNTKGYADPIRIPQYDTGYEIVFDMTGLPAGTTTLSGYNAVVEGTRADGLAYEFPCTITSTEVSFTIDTTCTGCPGRGEARIRFLLQGEEIATHKFIMEIEKSPVPDNAVDADVAEARTIADQVRTIVSEAAEQTAGRAQQIVANLEESVSELKSGFDDLRDHAFPSTAKVLLISLLKNAVYTSDQTDMIDALDTALNIGDIVAVTGISLDSSTKTVTAGDTVTITATVTPSNATNKGIVWTSSDETVATVNGGIVTGVGNGTAVITAKTVDGGFTATCSVTSTVVNLLDRSKSSVSNYVNRDNGQLASSDTFDATDFIWLEPNTTYYSEGCYLENFYAFYNANKVYVSSPPASVTITSEPDRNYGAHRKGTIVTGSQGYYFRGSYNKAVAYTPYIALTPIE